jgi:hypothetical protein
MYTVLWWAGNNGWVLAANPDVSLLEADVPQVRRTAIQAPPGITGCHGLRGARAVGRQAFSHFTWAASGGQLLVCDIQGKGDSFTYTDPQARVSFIMSAAMRGA